MPKSAAQRWIQWVRTSSTNHPEPLDRDPATRPVKGSINFTAHKSIRLTHLVVQIHGFVKVFKNATPPGEGIPAEASAGGSGLRGVRTRGNSFAKIFEDEQVLCGAGTLGPGRYQVPFHVKFPAAALPSSLDVCTSPNETRSFANEAV